VRSGRYAAVLVYSTGHAIRAERVLHLAGIETKLIPVPRHLSSNCGVCVRIAWDDREAAQAALDRANLETQGVFDLE
jgi:hypothetical protein